MGEEVQDQLVKLLESRKKTISAFTVCWFGGEPLMAFSVVERLSKKFIEVCEESDIAYNASMITYGYLLTTDILGRMKGLKLSSLQVTVDGMKEVHDSRRTLADGGATFDRIMQNLRDGYDLMPPISLRVNVDKNNIGAGEGISGFYKSITCLIR